MRTPIGSVGVSNLCTGAEVDLKFFARFDFHAPEREFVLLPERPDEAVDRPILPFETMLRDEVLMDALGRQAGFTLSDDQFSKRLALTATAARGGGCCG
uniref:hypothetical protein n=1 Tax=Roseimaritima sediminicola TaxID=2662066 RepID=UPI00192A686D